MKNSKISLFDLIGIGVGQIIGSGVMILTGIAIGKTGHGVPLAFIVAGIIVAITNICLATLGSAIPANGGQYTYVRDLIGKKAGFFYVALLAAGQLVLANYAIGFAEYMKELIPSINVGIVAGIMMTVVFLVNIMGVKTAVKFQNLLVIVLVISIGLFIVLGFPKITTFKPYTQMKTIMPNGFTEFVAGIFLVRFSLVGAEYINEFGEDAENPGKNIPLAMIISTVLVSIIYLCVGFVATGVLPIEEVAYKTLGNVANEIFTKPIYYFFMVGGAMFAVASSLNAVFAWAPKGLAVAVEDGWLPKILAKRNKKFNTPHFLLLIFYILGMIPIVTGGTLEIIAVLGNNIGLIFAAMPIIAVMFLPKRNKDAYEKAYFKLPRWAMTVLPIFCLFVFAGGFYSNIDFIGPFGIGVMFIYCVIVAIYAKLREPYVKIRSKDDK
ncbi:amino acid permease [Anaerococcus sp. AGMB00486]|uniref:Amino acid permease n=2 Tax=Anaerococcus TaxID=165779 RepID=A0ABX2NCG6_9FIRM|nr:MULTISPECIES: APC family permease [Anaerococcus]MSS77872.1 amino acid permease [Anaerococcus porci]NVF12376.1 amino acid permease [Anaerococcus faecalis]